MLTTFQTQCPYAYGYGPIKTPVQNETQVAANMINENFTKSNLVALVVPKERRLPGGSRYD